MASGGKVTAHLSHIVLLGATAAQWSTSCRPSTHHIFCARIVDALRRNLDRRDTRFLDSLIRTLCEQHAEQVQTKIDHARYLVESIKIFIEPKPIKSDAAFLNEVIAFVDSPEFGDDHTGVVNWLSDFREAVRKAKEPSL